MPAPKDPIKRAQWIENLRKSHIGIYPSKETIEKRIKTFAEPEVKARMINSHLGKPSPIKGKPHKPHSEMTKKKMSISNKIAQNRPGAQEKRIDARKNNNQPWHSEKTKQSMRHPNSEEGKKNKKIAQNRPERKANNSASSIKNWQNPEYVRKVMKARNSQPNKPERFLDELLQRLFLNEYRYVGDGQFSIAGKCPDFVNVNGQKKIIELYGDYWHRNDNSQDRIDLFAQFGYQTLVIWEHELEDVSKIEQKLIEFIER